MPVNETGAKPTSEEVDKYHGELVTVRSEVELDSRSFAVKKKKKKKKIMPLARRDSGPIDGTKSTPRTVALLFLINL